MDHPTDDERRPLARLHALEPVGPRGVVELLYGGGDHRESRAALGVLPEVPRRPAVVLPPWGR
eukprot:11923762-Alexandrium_andersonii.AAC.1